MTERHRSRRGFLLRSLAALVAGGCAARPAPLDDSVFPRLQQARFVLLGEVHDNAEQHRLRAALLTRLLADRRRSCVVFEQMDQGHDSAIDAAIDAAPRDADAVATAGQLDRKGWAWPLHKPLLDAALAAGATIRGGDLSTDDARAIVRGGPSALPNDLDPLMAGAGWQATDESRVEEDIDQGHCGALPKKLWPAMALAQRARDAALARAMLAAGRSHDRVILIAGNGHVRRDLGVPRYLVGAGIPNADMVSVGFLEQPDSAAPYDLVRITPAAERPDPCETFRAK